MILDPSINKIYYSSGDAQSKKYIELEGISDFSIQSNIGLDNNMLLGTKQNTSYINAPYEIKISFSKDYLSQDNILDYTGSNPILDFYFYNGKNYFLINNLYLTSYSVSFSVGDLPKIQTSLSSYGEKINNIDFINDSYGITKKNLDIPKLKSIFISGTQENYEELSLDNTIYEFNYSLNINRQPFYSIGKSSAVKIETIYPIAVQASISSFATREYKNYEIPYYENMNQKYKDFNIIVSGIENNTIFSIKNSMLINTNFSINSNSSMVVQKNYVGYYGL